VHAMHEPRHRNKVSMKKKGEEEKGDIEGRGREFVVFRLTLVRLAFSVTCCP